MGACFSAPTNFCQVGMCPSVARDFDFFFKKPEVWVFKIEISQLLLPFPPYFLFSSFFPRSFLPSNICVPNNACLQATSVQSLG